MKKDAISIFWFRRDLRLEDNIGLFNALNSKYPVLPVFIFDTSILEDLPSNDPRLSFIHHRLELLNVGLKKQHSSIYFAHDTPENAWNTILDTFDVKEVYYNEDYEPYARERDNKIRRTLNNLGIQVNSFKDQVIFAKDDVLKADGLPYTIYTPYKNKWLEKFSAIQVEQYPSEKLTNFFKSSFSCPTLIDIGFSESPIKVSDFSLENLSIYDEIRDIPGRNQTSHLSPHLRFGTVSIRMLVKKCMNHPVFLSELIWREFFMTIIYHFPKVINSNFKAKYNGIDWRNNEDEFEKWKSGQTGYPMVDAGMRELNATGYMQNRVRMITASFLCKHLLIDWRWGEAYFAEKLLDYELSSNNGNWQWVAGTGCDSAPYFRVFNPSTQAQKFDKDHSYINKWVPELNSLDYPLPMVDHKMARERAIRVYKEGIEKFS